MASMVRGLVFDAYDAETIALFWSAALGRDLAPGAGPAYAELVEDPRTGAPRIVFERVADGEPVRSRPHLDLVTPDPDGEARRLIGLGARRLGAVRALDVRVTLADPEGNTFDLVAA